MSAFDQAFSLLKMPFVSPDEIPEEAWAGVLGSVSDREQQNRDDFWVDDEEDPTAWGLHRLADYKTGGGQHIGAHIPFFEIHPSMRGKGKGREALMQMIAEIREHENMKPDSKVMAEGVIPSSKGFWERMYEDEIIHDYLEE
jgi:RimJ/RimL family protein N-acetyltransferase